MEGESGREKADVVLLFLKEEAFRFWDMDAYGGLLCSILAL
jgi:hypothetical protein